MIAQRAARITLDAALGKTHAALAAEHGISISRVGQIITDTLGRIGLSSKHGDGLAKETIGVTIVRHNTRIHGSPRGDTPMSFYWDELRHNLPVPSDTLL